MRDLIVSETNIEFLFTKFLWKLYIPIIYIIFKLSSICRFRTRELVIMHIVPDSVAKF